MENKQTAIEWLEENLIGNPYFESEFTHNRNVFEQAKQMEKEQIEKAFQDSMVAIVVGNMLSPEEYYNKTYGK
jgi:hypothetical protein